MSVTIREIAELAGVSVGTVSRVLNNHTNVKPALRLRVEAVVDKLDYRPSAVARSFKKKQTRMIGLIIPRIVSQLYLEMIHHTERLVHMKGYTLFLANTEEDIDTEISALKMFANMRVDGLILATCSERGDSRIRKELAILKTLGIPVVIAGRRLENTEYDMVTVDYASGSYQAALHIFEKGHRHVGIVAAPVHTSAGIDFVEGYIQACNDSGLPYDKNLICYGDRNLELDYPRIIEMLSRSKDSPTAMLVTSSFRLISVLRALRALEKTIPDDVSIVCFGDVAWCEFMTPPLTVLTVSTQAVSEHSHVMLFEQMNNDGEREPKRFIVKPELLVRDSVKTIVE